MVCRSVHRLTRDVDILPGQQQIDIGLGELAGQRQPCRAASSAAASLALRARSISAACLPQKSSDQRKRAWASPTHCQEPPKGRG